MNGDGVRLEEIFWLKINVFGVCLKMKTMTCFEGDIGNLGVWLVRNKLDLRFITWLKKG